LDPYIKNPSAALNPGPFREGDRVRLLWGVTPVEGIVIEDRGNLGVSGRRFYRVWIRLDEFTEPIETEEPAEDLTLVARPRTRAARQAALEAVAISPPASCPFCEGKRFVDPLAQTRSPGSFRVGDRVRLQWGLTPVEGIVIEDRGPRGRHAKRFYCVRVQLDDFTEPMELTEPAEELTLVAQAPTPRKRRQGKCQR
jgi:hypothetical protein